MFYNAVNNFTEDKIIMVEMEVWGSCNLCKNSHKNIYLLLFIFKMCIFQYNFYLA